MQLHQMEEGADYHMDLERQEDRVNSVGHLGMALDILVVAGCSLDKVLHLLLPEGEAYHKERLVVQDRVVDLRWEEVDKVLHQEERMEHKAMNQVGHIELLH